MLQLENVEVYYGKIKVINGISLKVDQGQLVVLLGANGTGKTTTLNTISGFLTPKKGAILYKGRRIDQLRPHQRVKLGIVQVSQSRDLFPDLSVIDNLSLGAVLQRDSNVVSRLLERVFETFPMLRERQKQLAVSLSGGEQQMLAIGRGLMSCPELMLLDEPTTGLAPILVRNIADTIKTIQREGTTILLVEQNAMMATALADFYYILRDGEIVSQGPTSGLPENLEQFFTQYYI